MRGLTFFWKPEDGNWKAELPSDFRLPTSSNPFNNNRRSSASAVADGCQSAFGVFLMQHIIQGGNDAGSAGAERVAQGNSASEDIDPIGVEFH